MVYDMILAGTAKSINKASKHRFIQFLLVKSSHNEEHLPIICIRYVDEDGEVQEAFVAFIKLQRVRASDIAEAIIATSEGVGINISDVRTRSRI